METTFKEKLTGNFSVQRLAGDASTREYSRLRFESTSETAVMVNVHAPFDPQTDDWLNIHEFLKNLGVAVPEVYFTEPSNGLFYLEDCGDELLESHAKNASPPQILELYKKALDVLVLMQTEGTRRLTAGNPAGKRKFDHEKLMWELNHAAKWYIRGYLKKRLSEEDDRRLTAFFERLIAPLLEIPTVFTHRDYHSRNIMPHEENFYIIDFQDARLGPPHYDVASLLFDSYVRLDEETRNELTEHYKKIAAGKILDAKRLASFEKDLARTALQRNIKALGTFGFQAVERQNSLYARFMPGTAEYVTRNLGLFQDLQQDAEWAASLLTPPI
ncbi:MAG: phosphotransferase [Nitrospinae bacterium]|nr:phosphotransferase [Nitrospinota bacterium]